MLGGFGTPGMFLPCRWEGKKSVATHCKADGLYLLKLGTGLPSNPTARYITSGNRKIFLPKDGYKTV